MWTCWPRGAGAANVEFGLALSDDEIDYLDRFTGWAQPDRRRADDVRAGQQRALPPQDLQRQVHHRRRGAAAELFGMIRNTEKLNPQHTVVAYSTTPRSWKAT
jgi:phosphoribosylformylglycinamidine synthase